jgi:hypothetical protein
MADEPDWFEDRSDLRRLLHGAAGSPEIRHENVLSTPRETLVGGLLSGSSRSAPRHAAFAL